MDATVWVVAVLGAVLVILVLGYLSATGARRSREQERAVAAHQAAVARPKLAVVSDVPPPAPEVEMYEGFCVRCKVKREFAGTVELATRGTRVTRVAKGACPACGAKINRFLPKSE